jgi:5'-nucleotidase (lipoprotein e(P4) family)
VKILHLGRISKKEFYKNVSVFFSVILLSNYSAAQSCQLPTESESNYDYDVQKDIFGINKSGTTDYFKLALSWSPDYCQKIQNDIAKLNREGKTADANQLEQHNKLQCFSNNEFKWVVHGLWASSCDGKSLAECTDLAEIKKHPRFCGGDLAQLPYKNIKPFLCMTPSSELLQGEWEKHGACDFPSAEKYFKKARTLFSSLITPTEKLDAATLSQWMDSHNPKLAHKKLGFYGIEMYVCYNKKFEPIDCPQKIEKIQGDVKPQNESNERLNSIMWMQTSAEYRVLAASAYQQAHNAIDIALRQKNWSAATEQKGNYTKLPPAIILDIDETVLDNIPYQAQLIKTHSEYNPTSWTQWTTLQASKAVPGASEFLKYAASKGVSIFYITNRDVTQEADTRANLEKLGLPLTNAIDTVLTKNENGWNTSDKSSRRLFVAEKFRILALIGDDFGDFVAGAYTSPEERVKIADNFANYWGTKWFLIPNPIYGSWETSLYDHNYKTSAAEVTATKIEKLVTP